jgi:NAD(P)-dependent dehydrogenase (short-subunit alcohol dehydrogenase family)
VDSPIWEQVAEAQSASILHAMAGRLPVGRIGQPEDVAHAIIFLLRNTYATGTILDLDGGHRFV